MFVFKTVRDIQIFLDDQRQSGKHIGFIPTMGALHEGHLTLIRQSLQQSDLTVCSIFVNPTQFNDIDDYNKYPITVEADIALLAQNHCDVLFLPSVDEMYPDGKSLKNKLELGEIESLLEGGFRPGHFQGVCQVVGRLLDIIQPDTLYMGQKDYQQVKVIRKMLQLQHRKTKLEMVPIVRADNGLALSSRNMRLSDQQKEAALVLSQTLNNFKKSLRPGSMAEMRAQAEKNILAQGFDKIDYVSICDQDSLIPVTEWDGRQKLVALIAAWIGGVRLIDNMELN